MFIKRFLSGIILLILAVFIINMSGTVLLLSTLILSLIAQFELYRSLGIEKKPIADIAYISSIIYYVFLYCGLTRYNILLFVSTMLVLLTAYVFSFPNVKTEDVTAMFFGFFYTSVLFSYIFMIRVLMFGHYFVWLLFLSSWGSDTCAYIVGMLIGKHKIAPDLSPKKSVEGCIGGVLGSGLLGLVYALVLVYYFGMMKKFIIIIVTVCVIGSVISQIGDFAASAIKRNHDIKDYGDIIPGHGGILDRFDSVIFAAPAVYYTIFFLVGML